MKKKVRTNNMRVIFMGTPDFAVGTLEEIIRAGHEVVLVVTQPDKPKGRGNAMQFPPVKECALAHDIEVFQPKRIRDDANVEYLKKYDADIIIVAAFGQILPKSILDMPRYGCVNVHASLLPKYRGAAPIQWAVINGDAITGVTTMRMDVGLDTGDMIAKREVRIAEDETGGSLFDKLAEVGAKLCVETMDMLEKGTATFTPQNNEMSTHTSMITKELGNIDWKNRDEVQRQIEELPARIATSVDFANAVRNGDKQVAQITFNDDIINIVAGMLEEKTEFVQTYFANPDFQNFVNARVFQAAVSQLSNR